MQLLSSSVSRRRLLAGAGAVGALATLGTSPQARAAGATAPVLPAGSTFPLGWYDIGADRPATQLQEPQDPLQAMLQERSYGWNMVHRYLDDLPRYDAIQARTLELAEAAKMSVLFQLPATPNPALAGQRMGLSEDVIAERITRYGASDALAWWDLPEELRYWYAGEMAVVRNYSAWTRRYDPLRRPVYFYTPNHYTASAIANYVPYIDLVPVSAYTTYAKQPHAWVRWRVAQVLEAISLAGATIGNDHLAGQKTPIAALELYHSSNTDWMTPEGAYHDFWAAIAAGARGIFIYSYYRRNGGPVLLDSLAAYNKAAAELTGPQHLDQVVLSGAEASDVSWEVVTGPADTEPFQPLSVPAPVVLPSIACRAVRRDDVLHLIMVNSSTEPVTVRVDGLRRTSGMVQLPFEGEHVRVNGGRITLEFAPLGVHIVRAAGC